ncbi:hypothetical protein [Alienimonas chondri]|uniref:Uncharacterized protein n=1 Tax=Alienimonas chondri TaxID=2681879 RepID=A0ABX1VBZ4_9PLAN|nr:hypothetical protein [Alienimonas chondri]NNJ24951.1 hypothetical protein [Alienimonas chondri]
MSTPAIASAQSGDFKGTVAIDGFDRRLLDKLRPKCNLPGGYTPIGFSLYRGGTAGGAPPRWQVRVVCVDASIAGVLPVTVRAYADGEEEIPAFSFATDLTLEDVLEHAKRFNLFAFDRHMIGGKPVRIVEEVASVATDEEE